MIKVSRILAEEKVFDFQKDYDIEEVRAIVHSRKDNLAEKSALYSISVSQKYLDHLHSDNLIGNTYIQEFINSAGKFYIPASSVKGALLTALNMEYLGIKEIREKKAIVKRADIKDKFVIHDSGYLSEDSFVIYRSGLGRPPLNFMCLDCGMEFSLSIPKLGKLSLQELKERLSTYYPAQIKKARDNVRKYYSEENPYAGANVFLELLDEISKYKLAEDEYLINLGFGGGNWFKLGEKAIPPKFYNEKTRTKEEAHTTYALLDEDTISQLGWCTLKIEEMP
jgi:CRISPR/Cas system CSM-associated protein Csm5 (group 7 of RAMP superfamily)